MGKKFKLSKVNENRTENVGNKHTKLKNPIKVY